MSEFSGFCKWHKGQVGHSYPAEDKASLAQLPQTILSTSGAHPQPYPLMADAVSRMGSAVSTQVLSLEVQSLLPMRTEASSHPAMAFSGQNLGLPLALGQWL